MNNSASVLISTSLLLELGRGYRSMPELNLVIFSVLKQIQVNVAGETASIWLLNESGSELECTHTIGAQAGDLLEGTMRAKKFLAAASKHANIDELDHLKWMDAKAHRDYFDTSSDQIIVMPLAARSEIMGGMIITNKANNFSFTSEAREIAKDWANHIAIAIQNTRLYEKQNHVSERQKLLNQISLHLHQKLDLDGLIPRIFADVNKAINAEAQSIWLVDEKAGVIKCRFATGPESDMLKGFTVSLSATSILGTSVSRKESIIIKDAQNDPRRDPSADEKTGFVTRSLMTVPLVLEDRAIGAIQAVNKRGGQLFNQDDLDLFRSIADSAALAVNNAQLVADLQNSYDLTLDALSSALDVRDRETEGHSRRVVEYTARLAKQIGLDQETIKSIRRGALIHDIGKIGVPDAVLNKPGSLNEEERKIIERHPQTGYYMLAHIPYLQEEIKIVVCHHEKWNGTGYAFSRLQILLMHSHPTAPIVRVVRMKRHE
jgi:putative nucleotidyltransferase with HDIG domain